MAVIIEIVVVQNENSFWFLSAAASLKRSGWRIRGERNVPRASSASLQPVVRSPPSHSSRSWARIVSPTGDAPWHPRQRCSGSVFFCRPLFTHAATLAERKLWQSLADWDVCINKCGFFFTTDFEQLRVCTCEDLTCLGCVEFCVGIKRVKSTDWLSSESGTYWQYVGMVKLILS